ncbi:MAG: zinc-ribbon domain-containing protein [Opitutales bacterium]
MTPFRPPGFCPNCGTHVKRGALACPNCGADERTGWNLAATTYDALDLPEHAFDDPETANNPADRDAPGSLRRGTPSVLRTVLVATLLVLIAVTYVFRRFV